MNVRIVHSLASHADAAELGSLLRSHWPTATVEVIPAAKMPGDRVGAPANLVVIVDGAAPEEVSAQIVAIRHASDFPLVVYAPYVTEHYQIEWLRLGADQVIDAVSAATFLAILDALMRRSNDGTDQPEKIRCIGDLTLMLARQELVVHQSLVSVTPTEYRLLEIIASEPGEFVATTVLANDVWGLDTPAVRDSLKVHMSGLRHKLAEAGSEFTVRGMRGHGYSLTDRVGGIVNRRRETVDGHR